MFSTKYKFFADSTAKTEDGVLVKPEHILIFFSGMDRDPPLGFGGTPQLVFSCEKYASASTCVFKLRLPLEHNCYRSFKEAMILSLLGNDGFGKT